MLPPIVLTCSMHAQLSILVRILRGSGSEEVPEFLEQELARANLVGDDELDDGRGYLPVRARRRLPSPVKSQISFISFVAT